jgi:hypothetical protein
MGLGYVEGITHDHPKPFMWTAAAESILAKIKRLCKVINGTRHQEPTGACLLYGATRIPQDFKEKAGRFTPPGP